MSRSDEIVIGNNKKIEARIQDESDDIRAVFWNNQVSIILGVSKKIVFWHFQYYQNYLG